MSRGRCFLSMIGIALACTGCVRTEALRTRLATLDALVLEAERNGAMRCAPRELAKARSQLAFAALELGQGSGLKARDHLDRAEPLARAAFMLSPAGYCARLSPSQGAPRPGARRRAVAVEGDVAQSRIAPPGRTGR
ncbi:MAG TPA: hypothetical protein VKY73_23560 [Polyangiaceae bacterium]|nr:hypothetical protein [Polyangiaceae bacterium]